MIVGEINKQARKTWRGFRAMEIQFHFVDGSKEIFIQSDAKAATALQHRISESNLFNQARIVVADDYSKSVFVCSQINRVDLVFNGAAFDRIPQ